MDDQPTTNGDRQGFLPSLRHRDFRVFYGGLVASSFGNNFTQLAMSWQMYEMTGSPLQLGLLGLSRAAATMPLLLFGGLLADAVDRRRLMMLMQCGHLCVAASLVALSVLQLLSPGVFYAATVLNAVFGALENPARQAIVPNLVPDVDLTNAIALNATQRSVSTIAGPPIAGIFLGFVGPTANYTVALVSWAMMLGALFLVHPSARAVGGRRAISLRSLRESFSYVWGHPILLAMMFLDFGANTLGQARALLPVYASDILGGGAQGFGILSGASAVGSLSGGLLMSVLGRIRHAGIGALVGVSLYAVCAILFAYNTSFLLAWLLLVGEGLGDSISHVFRLTILQLNVPDQLRGRVTSVNMLFTQSGGPLGSFRAGSMAQWLGPELAVFSGGVAVLGVVALIGAGIPMVRKFVISDTTPAHTGVR